MGQQKKYVISEETKKRCKILRLTPDLRKNFQALSLESFHFFYQMPALSFPLYFRSSHIMIEFMRPEEFSTELLQKLWQGTQSGFIDTEVCILKKDFELYQQALSEVRKLKYAKLKETVPLLDQKVLDLFQNLSSASQMIVRGGIDDNVVQKVKASAAHMVNNLMDSESAISTLTRMVLCDPTLYDHSASVAMIASVIGKFILKNPLSARENRVVSEAALYHDVGKTCIPSAVLNKPDKLSKEEFEIMKQHTVLGTQELNKIIENGAQIEKMATRVALEHHERFDGTGYPHGRKGRLEQDKSKGIHLYSRIVMIADVYSALLMKRVYKDAYDRHQAIKIMVDMASSHFDPDIFNPFVMSVAKSIQYDHHAGHDHDKSRIFVRDENGKIASVLKKPA